MLLLGGSALLSCLLLLLRAPLLSSLSDRTIGLGIYFIGFLNRIRHVLSSSKDYGTPGIRTA